MATRCNMKLFSTLDEQRLVDFLSKSSSGDSYTYGKYLLRIENINLGDLSCGEVTYGIYCSFDKNHLERGNLIEVRINIKNFPHVSGINSRDFYVCMTVLDQFFSKDNYNPFDEEDVKECE